MEVEKVEEAALDLTECLVFLYVVGFKRSDI